MGDVFAHFPHHESSSFRRRRPHESQHPANRKTPDPLPELIAGTWFNRLAIRASAFLREEPNQLAT